VRTISIILTCAFVVGLVCVAIITQRQDELATLNAEVTALSKSGKHEEALIPARKAFEIAERRYGHQHLEVANALDSLADPSAAPTKSRVRR
jgi:hypothetical protein